MSYLVLARKWRPQTLKDLIGQDSIVTALQNSVLHQKVAHAYLLTGTRGIGKTSVARILAKTLKCLTPQPDLTPCLQCENCRSIDRDSCPDVLELDSASHNSVNNVRQLTEEIHLLPVTGKYRIYIFDEVHMFTREAFNALLKTLEAPPAHIVFIFATTNPEKIPDTILSRCQRYDFLSLDHATLKQHLLKITQAEQITLTSSDCLDDLVAEADGSVRDALTLLEKSISLGLHHSGQKSLSTELVRQALGLAQKNSIAKILNALLLPDVAELSKIYHEVLRQNVLLDKLTLQLQDALYQHIQTTLGLQPAMPFLQQLPKLPKSEVIWIYEVLVKDLSWALSSQHPHKSIELILQKIALRHELFPTTMTPPEEEKKKELIPIEEMPPSEEAEQEDLPTPELYPEAPYEASETGPEAELAPPSELMPSAPLQPEIADWEEFIKFAFQTSPSLAANLEQGNLCAPPVFVGEKLLIQIGFKRSEEIFYSYLRRESSLAKLRDQLAQFYQRKGDQFQIELQLIDPQVTTEFTSTLELVDRRDQELFTSKKDEFLNNPYVQEAEQIFNSKVDQLIIDSKIVRNNNTQST